MINTHRRRLNPRPLRLLSTAHSIPFHRRTKQRTRSGPIAPILATLAEQYQGPFAMRPYRAVDAIWIEPARGYVVVEWLVAAVALEAKQGLEEDPGVVVVFLM